MIDVRVAQSGNPEQNGPGVAGQEKKRPVRRVLDLVRKSCQRRLMPGESSSSAADHTATIAAAPEDRVAQGQENSDRAVHVCFAPQEDGPCRQEPRVPLGLIGCTTV